jgi:pSer/pThr/pTyr-binding forkhead associated (FHA) protein
MAMRFLVASVEGTLAGGLKEVFLDRPEVVLGRGADADLLLPDPCLARRQLAVRQTPDGVRVEELGSRRLTVLNGRPLSAGQPVPLCEGDELALGPFRVVYAGQEQRPPAQDARETARALARRLLAGGAGEAVLRVENGPAAGLRLSIRPGQRLRLGRGKECELVIDDARVSRVHALISHQQGGLWLTDAGSTNGCYVEGARLAGPARLAEGCAIRLGRVRLRLLLARAWSLGWSVLLETERNPERSGWVAPGLALLVGLASVVVAMLL